MPTLDTRPGALDVLVYPGNALSLELTWPSALTGRTFTAAVNGTALSVSVVGAVVTVTFSAAVTAALTGRPYWKLTETTSGTQVRIRGRVLLTTSPTESQDATATVVEDTNSVSVSVLGEPGPPGSAGSGATAEEIQDVVGAFLTDSSTIDFTYDDGAGTEAADVKAGSIDTSHLAFDPATQTELNAAIAALSTVYQPLDSDLTAIAALTTTAFGRSVLALADAAAGRILLGLGTAATAATGDFDAAGAAAAAQAASQPLDADLTAIAALSTTAYGRAFLALVDAAAGRTALGLGTAATANTGDFDPAGSAAAAQAASQPLDSDLTAIAALVTTAYGRGLLTDADAAAFTARLTALLSGTYVPQDLSGLTSSAAPDLTDEIYVWLDGAPRRVTLADLQTLIDTGGGGSGMTQEEIEDLLGTSFLQAGTNVTLTYGDNGAGVGTLTIDVSSLSTEQVQDIVGAMATDNSDLDWTYDDIAGTLVAVIKAGSVTNAMLAGSIALSKLATDPLARANHTGTQSADTLTDGTTNKAFLATERTKLAGIETAADVTDEANVKAALDGMVTTAVTPASGDKILLLDVSDSDNVKHALFSDFGGGGGTVDVVSNVATQRILGRTTAGSGDSEELTPDQAWAVLGGALYVPQLAVVTSDVTHAQSNTALSDVTGMAFTIGASATEIWLFEILAQIGSASAAQDLKVGWSFPTGATMRWGIIGQGGSTTIAGFGATAAGADPAAWLVQTDTPAYGTGATGQTLAWAGWVFGGGTGGSVQFRFAQNTSTAADLKVKAGSLLRFTKLAA